MDMPKRSDAAYFEDAIDDISSEPEQEQVEPPPKSRKADAFACQSDLNSELASTVGSSCHMRATAGFARFDAVAGLWLEPQRREWIVEARVRAEVPAHADEARLLSQFRLLLRICLRVSRGWEVVIQVPETGKKAKEAATSSTVLLKPIFLKNFGTLRPGLSFVCLWML